MYESQELTKTIRDTLPGKYIALSKGTVYYELAGPEDGELVVFVSGFSVPMFCWNSNFEFFKKEGFRVLRYDHYGRGFSDRPVVKYNVDLFDGQLLELLTKLDLLKKKINLVGLSMGGLVVINFADRHPQLINKISLADPAGFPEHKNKFPGILKIPGLNKMVFQKIGIKKLLERLPINLYQGANNEKYPLFKENFGIQLAYKGYSQAILSTMLNFAFHLALDAYKHVGQTNIPVQMFWGEFDEVLAQPNQEVIKKVLPNVEFHLIKGSGHSVNYEQPGQYNPFVLKFLRN